MWSSIAMSSATRIGLLAGSTMPSWPTRDPLGLHRDEEVEQHRVVRELEALDVEVMLGEADRVVAEVVRHPRLLPQLGEHPAVQVGVEPGAPALDLGAAADAGQIEQRGAQIAHGRLDATSRAGHGVRAGMATPTL